MANEKPTKRIANIAGRVLNGGKFSIAEVLSLAGFVVNAAADKK